MRTRYWLTVTALVATGGLGCSKHEASNGEMTKDTSTTASMNPSSSPASSAAPDSIVRGVIKNVSDSVLTLSAPAGEVRIAVLQPLKVYSREPGDLTRVTDNTFIGVTSVPQPDGTQRATEIHVFPEELRGLGEGSRPMGGQQAGSGRSTMTNGNVANSRMTNGAARMTNGTSRGAAGGTMTVQYKGGTQTITVPSNVPVTVIAPTTTKLTSGTSVVVPAKKQSNGTLQASLVVLAAPRGR